jgi:hypothetical protein
MYLSLLVGYFVERGQGSWFVETGRWVSNAKLEDKCFAVAISLSFENGKSDYI